MENGGWFGQKRAEGTPGTPVSGMAASRGYNSIHQPLECATASTASIDLCAGCSFLPIDPRRLVVEVSKGLISLPEAAQMLRDLLLMPSAIAHRMVQLLQPAAAAAGGPVSSVRVRVSGAESCSCTVHAHLSERDVQLDAAVICGQLALLSQTQAPQEQCSAMFRVLEETAGGVSQLRLMAVLRVMNQGPWATEWLQKEMSSRGRTSIGMVEMTSWPGHQTVLQVLSGHSSQLMEQLQQLYQQDHLPCMDEDSSDSSNTLATIRDAVSSLWQLKQDMTSMEQGTAGMLEAGPSATVVAALRLKHSSAWAPLDENMTGELKLLKKRMTGRKITDKATTTQVKESLIGLQKDMQSKLTKEVSYLANSTQGCMLGILGKQTAALSQVAELTVPVLVELKQQISTNSDKIYRNTIHRYEVAKSVGEEARLEVHTLRSQVDQLMRHLDVMVGMPLGSLSETADSPSLSNQQTELISLTERHKQVFSQVEQHQAELLQHNSRLEKHEATLAQQVEENTARVEENSTRLKRLEDDQTSAVHELEQKMSAMQQQQHEQHSAESQQLRELIEQLQLTTIEQASQIVEAKEEHTTSLQQTKQQHTEHVEQIQQEHTEHVERVQQEHSTAVHQLEDQLRQLAQKCQEQVDEDTARHTQLDDSFKTTHEQLSESSDEQFQQLQERIDSHSHQHSQALASTQQQAREEVSALQLELSRVHEAQEGLRLEHSSSFASQVQANTEAIAEMNASHLAAREGLVGTDELQEVFRFTEQSQSSANAKVDQLMLDFETFAKDVATERADRYNSEHILRSVQAEQTAALGELGQGMGNALQETEVRIGQLQQAQSEQEHHLHGLGSELHAGLLTGGGDVNGIVNTLTSLSERLDTSITTVRAEVGQLRSIFDEQTALMESMLPKVSALERWVNEDVSQLMVEERAAVTDQLKEYQCSTETTQSELLESVEIVNNRIDEASKLSADDIEGLRNQIDLLLNVRREIEEQLKAYAPKELMIEERQRLSEHIDAQISGISTTQQDHIDCVHKLVQTSRDSMQFNLHSVSEAALAKCEEAAASTRAAMIHGLEQKARELSDQIENFRQGFNKGIEAKVVPIVAQYCVRALAEPNTSFPSERYSIAQPGYPPAALSSSPWATGSLESMK